MPHLVNNGVSISIICCLYVYCQTGNIATHDNLRFPQDTAERKVKIKLVESHNAMRFCGHKEKVIECSVRQTIKPGAYRFTCVLQRLYFFHSPIQYFPPWAGLRNNKPNYKNQQSRA